MPRTRVVEQTIFKFEELSDRAKDRVRSWLNDVSYEWWDFIYDDFINAATLFGIKVYDRERKAVRLDGTSRMYTEPELYFTDRYGWTAGFRGHFTMLNAIGCEAKVKEFAPADELLHKLAHELETQLCKFAIVGLESIVCDGGVLKIVGDEEGIKEVEELDIEAGMARDITEIEANAQREFNAVLDATVRDLARWLATRLQEESEYRWTDEYVQEMCEANEYEFFEDGSPA